MSDKSKHKDKKPNPVEVVDPVVQSDQVPPVPTPTPPPPTPPNVPG